MTKTYTVLDNKNIAIIETVENRRVVNKKELEDERLRLTKASDERIAEIDEILAQFVEI